MLDRSRRRFEEGTRLVDEAHKILGELQQALIGSPGSSRRKTARRSLRGSWPRSRRPAARCRNRCAAAALSVDQVQRLIRIDSHPIGITEMEYRVLELLAFARNNVVTRADAAEASLPPRPTTSRSRRSSTCSSPSSARSCAMRAAGQSSSRRSRSAAGSCATSTRRAGLKPFLACLGLARGDAALVSRCSATDSRPQALFRSCGPARERAAGAAPGRPVRRGPGTDLDDDGAIAAAWDDAGDAKRRLFGSRSAQLVGATAAGVEALLDERQRGQQPHAEASKALVDQIRGELEKSPSLILG